MCHQPCTWPRTPVHDVRPALRFEVSGYCADPGIGSCVLLLEIFEDSTTSHLRDSDQGRPGIPHCADRWAHTHFKRRVVRLCMDCHGSATQKISYRLAILGLRFCDRECTSVRVSNVGPAWSSPDRSVLRCQVYDAGLLPRFTATHPCYGIRGPERSCIHLLSSTKHEFHLHASKS